MKLRAQMLNHRLPLAPQPLTDHPAAASFVWTLLKICVVVAVVGNYRLQDIQLSKIRRCLAATGEQASIAACRLSRSRRRRPRAIVGGEYRARTGDLLVANQALSQLS